MSKLNEQASLYRRWNPTQLSDVCGNPLAVTKCKKLMEETLPSKRPGFYLITGQTGTGKSTLAHILFKGFGCGDIQVFNSRECGKIDFVTDFLNDKLTAGTFLSKNRAFIFEEAHNITTAAQEMFMEPMEKGIPPNTYVAFVTNCPEKLTGGKGALVSRPFRIDTCNVKPSDMIDRLRHINANEPLGLSDTEVISCASASNGSVRVAINNMERLAMVPADFRERELERIKLDGDVSAGEIAPNLKDLAIALEKRHWDTVAPILKKLREEGEDPEGLRRGLLAWYSGILVSDKPFCRPKRPFAQSVIDCLRENYYNTGFAGLIGDLSHIANIGIDK